MAKSQNGWPVIDRDVAHPRLRNFKIPGVDVAIPLRDGCAGFLLAHYALWHHERVESLNNSIKDEWGYAPRPIRGSTSVISNHASGTAADLNATKHPRGKWRTFRPVMRTRIRRRLKRAYRNQLRSGISYTKVPDDMHVEIVSSLKEVNALAIELMVTPRGKRILRANPGLKAVILS